MSSSSKSKSSRRREPPAGTPGGAKLRAVREQARRSQLWVEAEADLGTGYLQRVESGRVAQPGRATVEAILDALGARYSERRDVLELFGYVVATPLPTPAEIAWARESCQHELHDVPFPAYVLDCYTRLIAWNRFVPCLLGDRPSAPTLPRCGANIGSADVPVRGRGEPARDLPVVSPSPAAGRGMSAEPIFAPRSGRGVRADTGADLLEQLVGCSLLASWCDPASLFGALLVEPELFLPALVRALRFEIEQYRNEPWVIEMLAQLQAELPHFRLYWERAAAEPPPISAARVLVPLRLAVPGTGPLQFRLVAEPFVRDTRFRLVYFLPADPVTMRQCASWAAE